MKPIGRSHRFRLEFHSSCIDNFPSEPQKVSISSNDSGKVIENFNYIPFDTILSEQPPPYSQLTVSISPITAYYEKNLMKISPIVEFRKFFFISTSIYILWGLLAFIITTIFGIISSSIPYFGFWSAFLILNGLMNILSITLFKSPNEYNRFKRMFQFTLFLNTIGFLITTVGSNSKLSISYLYALNSPCENVLRNYFQWTIMFIFLLTTIHNLCNIFIVYKFANVIKTMSMETKV